MIYQTFILTVVIVNVFSNPVIISRGLYYSSPSYPEDLYFVPHRDYLTFAPQSGTVFKKDKPHDIHTTIPAQTLIPGQSVLSPHNAALSAQKVVPSTPSLPSRPLHFQPIYSGSDVITVEKPYVHGISSTVPLHFVNTDYKNNFAGIGSGLRPIVPVGIDFTDKPTNLWNSLIAERELLNNQIEYLSAYGRPMETDKVH